jgi:hypothetical protein
MGRDDQGDLFTTSKEMRYILFELLPQLYDGTIVHMVARAHMDA